MNHKLIFILSRKNQQELIEHVESVINYWVRLWFLKDKSGNLLDFETSCSISNNFDFSEKNCNYFYKMAGGNYSIVGGIDDFKELLNALIPASNETIGISESEYCLLLSSLEALIKEITSESVHIQLSNEMIFQKKFNYYLELRINDAAIHMELPGNWISKTFPVSEKNIPLIATKEALSLQHVSSTISLNTMKIKASDALTLKVGEVIKFDHKIYEPLNFHINETTDYISKCNLGRFKNNKSILLE